MKPTNSSFMTMSQRLVDSVQKADFHANSIVGSISRVLENSSNMQFIAKCCTNLQVTTPDDASLTLTYLIWNLFKRQQGINRPDAVEPFSHENKQDFVIVAQSSVLHDSELQPNDVCSNNSYYPNVDHETENAEETNLLNRCFIEYDRNISNDSIVDPLKYDSQTLYLRKRNVDFDLLAARSSPNFFSSTPIGPEQFDVSDNEDSIFDSRDPFLDCLIDRNFDESIEVQRSQLQTINNESEEDFCNLGQSWDSLKLSSFKDSFHSDLQSIRFSRSDCLNESQLLKDFYINDIECSLAQNLGKLSGSIQSNSFSGTPSEALADEALKRLAKSLSEDPTPYCSCVPELMDSTPDSSKLEINWSASNSSTLKAFQSAECICESQILYDSQNENDSSVRHDINLLSDNINYSYRPNDSFPVQNLPTGGPSPDELTDIALKLLSEKIKKENDFYSNFEVDEGDSDDSVKVLYDFCDKRTDLDSLGSMERSSQNINYVQQMNNNKISANDLADDLRTQCRGNGNAIIDLEIDVENMSINSEDEISNFRKVAKVEWINEVSVMPRYGAASIESSVKANLTKNFSNQFPQRTTNDCNDYFNKSFSSDSSEDSVSLLQNQDKNFGDDGESWNPKSDNATNKTSSLKENFESCRISRNSGRKSLIDSSDGGSTKIPIMEDEIGSSPSDPSGTPEEVKSISKGIFSRLKEVADTWDLSLNFNDFKW